ncbi:tripartite tricarboxylate transporter permease [Chloroflexota bacterium]
MILEAFGEALQYMIQPSFLLAMLAGTMVGLVIGIIPGLGGTIGLAIFLPFVFGTPPLQALPFMVAIWGTTATGGAITSILLNVPGSGANVATLLDGYPMTRKGEAGRAIGAALTSSATGGAATALMALALVPLILPMILAIFSADMVFIILMGLALMAVLSKGNMLKGLAAGGCGLMLALVGFDDATGIGRFTLGTLYLYEGIEIAPLVLGLFALPTMIELARKGGTITKVNMALTGVQGVWRGARDVARHWWLWLRCTVFGLIIGIIPGVGASASTFMVYAHAKQTSKHPELFGTGIVEGVIAPESTNNAKDGGALLTTLALGIPGSVDAAILIGAFLLVGLIPGPAMFREHLGLSLSLVYVLVLANILAAAICFVSVKHLIKIASVPGRLLAPVVIIFCLVGSFAHREVVFDIVMTLIFAVLGLVMIKFKFNRPTLLLAFVLGSLFESYYTTAYRLGGPLFFLTDPRPISISIIILLIGVFAFGPIRKLLQRRRRGEPA